MFDLKLYTYK